MNFSEIAKVRQSCRKYDSTRVVESEKLEAILNVARLSPSACNGQPYKITVCKGDAAKQVAKATQSMGLNGFSSDPTYIGANIGETMPDYKNVSVIVQRIGR